MYVVRLRFLAHITTNNKWTYSWGTTSEYRLKIVGDLKFQVEAVAPHQ